MKVRRRRTQKPTVRLDVSRWRELLDDGSVHVARGIVVADAGSHFEIVEGGADVLVEVELQPSLVRCSARLSGLGGGAGRGFWAIPQVGAEVIVGVPGGELEAGPVIIAAESMGQVPDGLGPTTYVACVPTGGQLLVHDGTASQAVPLATKADVDALKATVDAHKTVFDAHIHVLTIAAAAGAGGTGTAAAPVTSFAAPSAPAGTTVLRSK